MSAPRRVPSLMAEGLFAGLTWAYSAAVLLPAAVLLETGALRPDIAGTLPAPTPSRSPVRRPAAPPQPPAGPGQPAFFEGHELAYADAIRPMGEFVVRYAMRRMEPYLAADSWVLDLGCGPGDHLITVARRVPRGRVVGIDAAASMAARARKRAEVSGLSRVDAFCALAADLPHSWDGLFDVVYSVFADHHFEDRDAVASGACRVLRPGGVYCIVDPGRAASNALWAPLAAIGDPGWVGFSAPSEHLARLRRSGFATAAWCDLLPGFGIAVGQTPA